MSEKLNVQKTDVVSWLYNSNSAREQWLKHQQDKLAEDSAKECTFKPKINKRESGGKAKFRIKQDDVFNELYQKAKRERMKKSTERTTEEIEYEKQKDQCTFHPDLTKNKRHSSSKKSISARKDSQHDSNQDHTTSFKTLDQKDIDYVSRKIEEIKEMHQAREEEKEREVEYSPVSDSFSNSKPSPLSPDRFKNLMNLQNRLASETPKTEELEEEMRDQVLDYQNPVFRTNLVGDQEREINIQDMDAPLFHPNMNYQNMSPESNDLEYISQEHEDPEDNPLLFVDVNLGPNKAERIVVFEGDTAEDLAFRFSQRHNLNDIMRHKLTQLLEAEISGINSEP